MDVLFGLIVSFFQGAGITPTSLSLINVIGIMILVVIARNTRDINRNILTTLNKQIELMGYQVHKIEKILEHFDYSHERIEKLYNKFDFHQKEENDQHTAIGETVHEVVNEVGKVQASIAAINMFLYGKRHD